MRKQSNIFYTKRRQKIKKNNCHAGENGLILSYLYSSSFPPCWVCRWYLSAAVTCFSADWAITSSVSRDCAGFRTSRVRFPLASWLDNPVSCIGSNFSGTRPIWCSSDRISATWIRLWCRVWSYFIIIISVDDRNTTFIPSLFLSLSRLKPKKSSAREEDDRMGEMGDAVCSRRERKRPTNATDEEREEEKKVSQKSGNRKTNRRWFFFLHFFPPLSCLLSSPSEVLRFLFEGKTSFFVVVLCITVLRDIKTPLWRFVAIL